MSSRLKMNWKRETLSSKIIVFECPHSFCFHHLASTCLRNCCFTSNHVTKCLSTGVEIYSWLQGNQFRHWSEGCMQNFTSRSRHSLHHGWFPGFQNVVCEHPGHGHLYGELSQSKPVKMQCWPNLYTTVLTLDYKQFSQHFGMHKLPRIELVAIKTFY